MEALSGDRAQHRVQQEALAERIGDQKLQVLALEKERQDVAFPRIYGFLSERMLDCWLAKNGVAYQELPVYNTEPQHWGKKIYHFLKRKLTYAAKKPEKETAV